MKRSSLQEIDSTNKANENFLGIIYKNTFYAELRIVD